MRGNRSLDQWDGKSLPNVFFQEDQPLQVAAGALVVVLLGWRSRHNVLALKTCVLNGGRWNAAAHRCEPQP